MRLLLLITLLLFPTTAFSFELMAGFHAIESGDNYFRPSLNLRLNVLQDHFIKAHYYGRDYGPISERTVLATIGKAYPVGKFTKIDIGLTYCKDITTVRFTNQSEPDLQETSEDLGLHTSLRIFSNGAISLEAEWGGDLLAAGLGTILLANERRQFFGLNMGIKL